MSGEDIKKLNSDIYRMLDISETSMNKDFLLREKFKELTTPKKVITSGNGYVDILLIMSIIVTVIMSVVVVATIIL